MLNSTTKILPLEAPPADGNLSPLPPSQLNDQEVQEKAEQNNPNKAVATHTKAIGIIHPPPDIKAIIQTTAKYVSDTGSEFEKKIIAKEAENARFNFLKSSDLYHAFYKQKLTKYRAQSQDGAQASVLKPDSADDNEAVDAKPDLQAQFRVPPKALEAPEPEKYTVRVSEGITSEELDIIKLTAQFAGRNGQLFLNGLQSRESNNPLFQFMKPTHWMFPFFNALINVYLDVLMPPKDFKEKLRKSVADFTTVRDRCLNRLEWDRSQEQQRKKEEDEKELERVQMAMIDWHDFSAVASIDFADEEDEGLPPPTTYEDVTRKRRVSTMAEDGIVEMEMDEEEVKLVAEGMRATTLEEEGGSMKIGNVNGEEAASMRIVKNWKRPEDRIATERDLTKVVISPITGELIPINEMSEHMRISLIDPKFKELKDRMFAKIRDTTLAHDDEIAKNIVGLARLRPDIFGTTEEEVSNAVKAEIEKKKKDEQPKQVIWDGHTGSIGRTANQALTQNSNGQEQGNGVYGDPSTFPGLASLPPSGPGLRPLPPPPNLALNLPRPPPSVQYPGSPRPLGVPVMQSMHQQHQFLMPGPPGHLSMMMNLTLQMQPSMPVPPPPGSHFAHLQVPKPYGQFPPPSMGMMQPPPMSGMHPPPPPVEAQPTLPEEPEPKRQKLDESALVPEDQFLAQHPKIFKVLPRSGCLFQTWMMGNSLRSQCSVYLKTWQL
ncbi:probable splicing factor 3A subunit 1 isoform X1 [Eutrema salsugineum]|uniref:probable splicing factor 3A subunit 1 isoform X1 n=1 Tax=Eutrema salsugineum TaxID=72664 RepID=UPI000CED4396|nr:probable splicing factor 3A subunit 1 isoform X1 [Eutrema salsugineum]XP_024016850.1 probable splicing factor 3A subunit 1 isoform X1 [Eutrema salsugineum]